MEKAITNYIKKLNEIIEVLKEVKYDIKETLQLNTSTEKFNKQFDYSNIIYVIRTDMHDLQFLKKEFSNFKEENKDEYKLSKLNKVNNNFKGVLYVGSSMTSIRSRIRQHLGITGKKVYSLQLSAWLPDHEIYIDFYQFNNKIFYFFRK